MQLLSPLRNDKQEAVVRYFGMATHIMSVLYIFLIYFYYNVNRLNPFDYIVTNSKDRFQSMCFLYVWYVSSLSSDI